MTCKVCNGKHSNECNYEWYINEANRLREQAVNYERAARKCLARKPEGK